MPDLKALPDGSIKPTIIVNPEPQLAPIVADLSHNMIILSQEFNQFTQEMPVITADAKRVLGLEDNIKLDLDNMADEDVEKSLKTLEKPMKLWREFSNNRTQVNRQLTNFTNTFKTTIEEVAKGAGFDELDTLHNEGLRIQKEISNNRKRKAWNAAYEIYETALGAYPQIAQVFPELTQQDSFERIVTNFALFKVTGSKSFKITSTIKMSIAELADRLGKLATNTLNELATLPPETHASVIRTLISQPDTETLYKQIQLQRTSIEAKARSEKAKAAALTQTPGQMATAPGQAVHAAPGQAAPTSQGAQAAMPFAQPAMSTQGHPVQLIAPLNDNGVFFQSARDWLLQVYVPQFGNQFYDVLTNSNTKLILIMQLTAQMQDATSQVSKILGGNADAALTLLLAAHAL